MEHELAAFDLRPRHLVALTLLRVLGEMGQAELAERVRLDRTNLVGLLNELEAAGLIERRRAPEDRRRHTVLLTRKGHERLAKIELTLVAVEDELLTGLDAGQREQLHTLLQQAVGAINGADAGC